MAMIGAAHPVCQRLMAMPGLGPLTATALVAAGSEATQLKHGRQCAAWVGLVPQQHSTGGKPRLLGISQRGDVYLRTLLVHGARATLRWRKTDRHSTWRRGLIARRGKNKAAVALAKKNARIVWVLRTADQVDTPAAAASRGEGQTITVPFTRCERRLNVRTCVVSPAASDSGGQGSNSRGVIRRGSADVIMARRTPMPCFTRPDT